MDAKKARRKNSKKSGALMRGWPIQKLSTASRPELRRLSYQLRDFFNCAKTKLNQFSTRCINGWRRNPCRSCRKVYLVKRSAIRPFCVGRKNWLFAGNPKVAQVSAMIYSLLESAKANKLEPYKYLRYLFEKLPFAETIEDYRKLLPSSLSATEIETIAEVSLV